MRVMIANAAPWSFALKQQYVADFPPESLWEIYGSTELGVDCVLKPEDQMRKPGSCGQPAPGIEVVLFDADGNGVTGTGPEHPGEVFVRSKGVFDEYYKQQDSYDAASRGDFHTVGDIAYWDDEGYLYICDRKSRHDHLGWHEHLPGRDRGGARAAPGDLRRRGVRHPVRGVGRDRARDRRAGAGSVADR